MLDIFKPRLHFAHFHLTTGHQLRTIQTLDVADAIRQILLGIEGEYTDGEVGLTFSGHLHDGQNEVEHQHAFIIPIDSDNDGLLDAVVIHAPLGFSIPNLVALENIQAERIFGEAHLDLIEISHLAPLTIGDTHTTWRSITPLLSFRFYKRSAGTLEDWWLKEVQRSCRQQQRPEPIALRFLSKANLPSFWKKFGLERPSKPNKRAPFAKAVELTFATPISGPLLIGEFSHFGMGRMEPHA